MKKVLSVILAMAMVLALGIPAFASTTTDTTLNDIAKAATGASTTMNGETQVPTINIVVPKTATIIVNPYKISVTPTGGTATQDTVICPDYFITNKSDIALTVGTKITGKVGTGVTFATAAPAANATGNDVYLKFEATPLADDTEKGALDWDTDTNKVDKVVSKTAEAVDDIDLPAASSSAANYIAYHVTGEAASAPTKPWTAAMTASVTVAFTFKPVANTVGSGTTTPSVTASMTGTPTAGASVTLNAAISNIDASKNPTYSWSVTTDANSIVDSFTDSTASNQTVNIAAGATSGQSATLTVTVTYDATGSQDATVTDTVTITMP